MDVHEHFVQVPRVARASLPTPQRPRLRWPERATPLPDGLAGDRHAALIGLLCQSGRHRDNAHSGHRPTTKTTSFDAPPRPHALAALTRT